MQRAMEDLGMTSAEIMDIFRIMAAILKLGNVNFIPTTNMDGTEGCAISNDYGELFSWEHDQDGGLSIHTNTRENPGRLRQSQLDSKNAIKHTML